jgi:uncharacterized protein (TIGR04255 family)
MLPYLRPVAKNHSIGKVVANFYLPQSIISLEDMLAILRDNNDLDYQKKTLIKSKVLSFRVGANNSVNPDDQSDKVTGILFEQYGANGLVENILKIENDDRQNKAILSFECRKYTRWNNFFEHFSKDFATIVNVFPLYIEAISLTYIDEFVWNFAGNIPVDQIFNVESDLVNKKFLNSANGTILILSQNAASNEEERTEIKFSNRVKRITIQHQFAVAFDKLYSPTNIQEKNGKIEEFDRAHESNKSMLKDLLTDEVKSLIKL